MNFAREVADHVSFTDRGVIVEHGPPETLFTAAMPCHEQSSSDAW